MLERSSRTIRGLSRRTCARCLVLAMVLALLAGCASSGAVAPQAAVEQQPADTGPSVTRFDDGRLGFMITETAQLDEPSRREFERAVTLLENQEYGAAVDILEKVVEQAPGVSAPYINLAIACRHLGKPDQAEEHLKTALQLIPAHPVASNQYGLLYRQSGRFAEARAVYEQALSSFPDYYPLHRNLGILCDLYLDDAACALAHYEIYSQALPEDRQVQMWIADLRARLGSQ